MFKRLRLVKWNPILFKVFGDAGYIWGGFDNVGKGYWRKLIGTFLLASLRKSVEDG